MTDKIQENAQPLFDMLCRAFVALESEELIEQEGRANLISEMGALIESVKPVAKEYEFNLKIFASLKIVANSEAEAVAKLENVHFETGNLGAFDDGAPIICEINDIEDSSGGPLGAVKIDGEEV